MFNSLFSNAVAGISVESLLLCTVVSLVLGFLIALIYHSDGKGTSSFMLSLVLLPMLVQMVILMVNGNLGVGVAVAGTFGLVRFRSVPGTSREICFIFLCMAVGLATGMGYASFAVFMTAAAALVVLGLRLTHFTEVNQSQRDLRVTIPENLDYTEIFDDIFDQYLKNWTLERVKTTNLGSMIECRYTVILKDVKQEKQMIDALRCRNGNLTILCSRFGNEEML